MVVPLRAVLGPPRWRGQRGPRASSNRCQAPARNPGQVDPTTGTMGADLPGYPYFYHPDHLGSASLVTDFAGTVVNHNAFRPYGSVAEEYKSAAHGDFSSDYKYTDKELDEEIGLVYFGARYYWAELGRWVSADGLFVSLLDVDLARIRELNLMSYTLANPFSYIDLYGLAVGIPVEQRPFDSATDVPPGRGHDTYTVYKFAVYDFENMKKYEAATPEEREAKLLGHVELTFAAQMGKKPSILGDGERTVAFSLLPRRVGSPRAGKHQFLVHDEGARTLTYPGNADYCTRSGYCENSNIQIHPGGPAASEGCVTSPLLVYNGRSRKLGEKDDVGPNNWTADQKKIQFEEMVYSLFGLDTASGNVTGYLRLPGEGVAYPSQDEYDWSSADTSLNLYLESE